MSPLKLRLCVLLFSVGPLLGLACSDKSNNSPTSSQPPVQPGQPGPAGNPQTLNPGVVNQPVFRQNDTSPVNLAAAAGDWAQFRGPGGMGVSPTAELPTKWSDDDNIAWKTPLPGAGASSPIVFGDHIYLTAYTGFFVPGESGGNPADLVRHLICIDKSQGNILWDKPVKAKLPEEERIRDHGFAASTPAADSDAVYVFFGKSGVLAFSHEGEPIWQADVGSKTHGWGSSASPVIYQDLVFINASVESESLVALDRRTGEEKWRARGIKEAWNTPVLVKNDKGEDELIITIQGEVLAYNPLTGDPLWTCNTDITWYMVPCVVAADGIVYVLGGRSGITSLAVRAGGRGDVTKTHRLWTSNKGSNVTSPVVYQGHLYWMQDQEGIAYCAEATSGELKYQQRINRAGQIYAASLLAGDKIYYLNRTGTTYVVAANPEFQLLETNTLRNRDNGVFNASPAVMGKQLLLRSDKFLFCIGQ